MSVKKILARFKSGPRMGGLEVENEKLRDKVKALTTRVGKVSSSLGDVAALHCYRSLTSGRSDWASKWGECETPGKRVLFFTATDFAGSFYKWAEAVNRETPHAVRIVHLKSHAYGYPLDLLYMRSAKLMEQYVPGMLDGIARLAAEADIIHLKDQEGFIGGSNGFETDFFTRLGKPVVYTLYGGNARKLQDDKAFRDHVRSFDAVVAMTPDLLYPWVERGSFIPHGIDTSQHQFAWREGSVILHTPSNPERKGTAEFTVAASRIDQEFGTTARILTGVPPEVVMSAKPQATLFFDQAGRTAEGSLIGWYGNSALEAAVFGVPTMAHLSPQAIEQAGQSGYDVEAKSAILNVEPTEDGMYRVMREFFDMTPKQREQIAKQTREWIEKHHSYRATSKALDKVYRSL